MLIEKLADIHAGYFGYGRSLGTTELVRFLQVEFGRVGADTHLTPREVIRDFVELLDILCQNPGTTMDEVLGSANGGELGNAQSGITGSPVGLDGTPAAPSGTPAATGSAPVTTGNIPAVPGATRDFAEFEI